MGWNDVKNTHAFGPRTPEDLLFLYHADFRFVQSALIFESFEKDFTDYVRNPSWEEQLEFDENLKTRLKVICKNSGMEGRRLLTMFHASPVNLESILTVFPDAQIITLHREPISLMKSACSLIHCNVKPCYRVLESNKIGVGRRILNAMKIDTEKLINWRKNKDLEAKGFQRFIDVQFKDLVKEPLKTMEKVYNQLDMKLDDKVKRNMMNHLNKHRNKTAKSKYTLEEYGLNKEIIQQTFQKYCQFFNVQT